MSSKRHVITIKTEKKEQVINITPMVSELCRKSGIQNGLVLVFPMHTSSTVYISDSDLGLTEDWQDILEKLAPSHAGYRHDKTDLKQNASGHLRAILCGHHITLPLTNGDLDLGTYQTIYYLEFDGQRPKEIMVKIIGTEES